MVHTSLMNPVAPTGPPGYNKLPYSHRFTDLAAKLSRTRATMA